MMIVTPSDTWHKRMIQMAHLVASWSKDPSTKCGAVITNYNHDPLSWGYNHFPARVPDNVEDYADREKKLSQVIHAELDAIIKCVQRYNPMGKHMFITGPSCDRCAAHVIHAGINKVYWPTLESSNAQTRSYRERWPDSIERALSMYNSAGVEVHEIDMTDWELKL